MLAELTDRAVIAISGPEAREFLQGLITNDVKGLAPDRPLYAALLTPQGKILFDFIIAQDQDGLLLDCRREMRAALVKRLSLYKLRAKVEIKLRNDLACVVGGSRSGSRRSTAPSLTKAYDLDPDPSCHPAFRTIRPAGSIWAIPEGTDFGSDKMFALDAGLDELHAVAFDKGCYVGQELTARMKHRGTARKRLLPVTSADGGPLPARFL